MTQKMPDSSPETDENHTHFGFQTVPMEQKSTLVKGVFDQVASRYDLMNDVMSFGLHRHWKNEMVSWLNPAPDIQILDVAGGTGDIALRMRNYSIAKYGTSPKITLSDINQAMLLEGKKRMIDQGLLGAMEYVCANAESLPLDDCSMDAYTIAFGIRNVTHIEKALQEAHRVLKPGGRFICLEFSHVEVEPMAKLYDLYSFHVIPAMGKIFAGKGDPYQYLVESIRQFPKQADFLKMIKDAGFGNATYRNMNGGVVAIHSGWRI